MKKLITTIKGWLPTIICLFALFLVAYLLTVTQTMPAKKSVTAAAQIDSADILKNINPPTGFTINATYGDIGPKLLASGAIDFERMKSLYEQSGVPLTCYIDKEAGDKKRKTLICNGVLDSGENYDESVGLSLHYGCEYKLDKVINFKKQQFVE